MGVNLCWAGKAGTTPGSNVTRQMGPNIVGGNEMAGGLDTWVGKIMNMMKKASRRERGTRGWNCPVERSPWRGI